MYALPAHVAPLSKRESKFAWDDAPNPKLKVDRGVGFEDVVFHIDPSDLLDILEHASSDRDAGQRTFVVQS